MQRRRCCPFPHSWKLKLRLCHHFHLFFSPLHAAAQYGSRTHFLAQENPNENESMLKVFLLRTICCCFRSLLCLIFPFANISSFQYSDIVVRVFSMKNSVFSGVDSEELAFLFLVNLSTGARAESVFFCSFLMLAGSACLLGYIFFYFTRPAADALCSLCLEERSRLSQKMEKCWKKQQQASKQTCENAKNFVFHRENRNKLLTKILCRYYVKVDWKVPKLFIRVYAAQQWRRVWTGSAW